MPGLSGNQQAAQYFQANGEATQQEKLPKQFRSTPAPTSPLSDHLSAPKDFAWTGTPIVHRAPRMNGFRRLYSRGMDAMPIKRYGADGTPLPWTSSFQRNNEGPIRNGSFNDALYQAGYPGFNLGISFKVQTLDTRRPVDVKTGGFIPVNITGIVKNMRRPSGRPPAKPTEGSMYNG